MEHETGVVTVTTECRYVRTPEGVFTSGVENGEFFQRYLAAFDAVRVVARVSDLTSLPNGPYRRLDVPGVEFRGLPPFGGLRGFLTSCLSVFLHLARIMRDESARGPWILRVPGAVATLTWMMLRVGGRRFAVEVTTDPSQEYAGEAVGSATGGVLSTVAAMLLRRQCHGAIAASYVTESRLQQLFPTGSDLVGNYSSIDLDPGAFERASRVQERIRSQPDVLQSPNLVFVGHLERPLKGLDVLLEALGRLVSDTAQPGLQLTVVGDGALRPEYEQEAEMLGIRDQVCFVGRLPPGDAVFDRLEESDLFVLPSRREGLPRVVIEAMAVGLPCVSTDVSGARELLSEEDIVPIGDPEVLAVAITSFLTSRERRLQASLRNSEKATEYSGPRLQVRRRKFYSALRDRSAKLDDCAT